MYPSPKIFRLERTDHHRTVILSEASQLLGTRSRRTPKNLTYPYCPELFYLGISGTGVRAGKGADCIGDLQLFGGLLTQSAPQTFESRFASGVLRLRSSQKTRATALRMTHQGLFKKNKTHQVITHLPWQLQKAN